MGSMISSLRARVKDWGSRSTRIYFEIALSQVLRSTTLPTLALPPVCSAIAPDRLRNAITTKRAVSRRAALCRAIFWRSDMTIEAPSIRKTESHNRAAGSEKTYEPGSSRVLVFSLPHSSRPTQARHSIDHRYRTNYVLRLQ